MQSYTFEENLLSLYLAWHTWKIICIHYFRYFQGTPLLPFSPNLRNGYLTNTSDTDLQLPTATRKVFITLHGDTSLLFSWNLNGVRAMEILTWLGVGMLALWAKYCGLKDSFFVFVVVWILECFVVYTTSVNCCLIECFSPNMKGHM